MKRPNPLDLNPHLAAPESPIKGVAIAEHTHSEPPADPEALKREVVELLDGSFQQVVEITLDEWKETRAKGEDFDNEVALVSACTGLHPATIEDMLTPDFNELRRAAINVNNPTTKPAKGVDHITLKTPALTVMGESTNVVRINTPKVKASRELDKIENPQQRIEYMIRATTMLADLGSMRMSDYTLLVLAVPDFFAQGAAFFRRNK